MLKLLNALADAGVNALLAPLEGDPGLASLGLREVHALLQAPLHQGPRGSPRERPRSAQRVIGVVSEDRRCAFYRGRDPARVGLRFSHFALSSNAASHGKRRSTEVGMNELHDHRSLADCGSASLR